MILLTSTSDLLRVTTSSTADVDVHASFVDMSGSTITPGRKNTAINTGTTTTVVASPAPSTQRTVKSLHIRNRHASSTNDVTVLHTDGTTSVELIKLTLQPGWVLHYDEGAGFEVLDSQGRSAQNSSAGSQSVAVGTLNAVVLSSDQTNNNAVANTIQDVTGLSFSVTAGETYWFRFVIDYTSAATTTGSRWAINGPGSPTRLSYWSENSLSAAAGTDGVTTAINTAYDTPAASNATSANTAGNIVVIEGFITPSANGTVIARFASEVSSSAIVAKAGSLLQWMRTL